MEATSQRPQEADAIDPDAGCLGMLVERWQDAGAAVPVAIVVSVFDDVLAALPDTADERDADFDAIVVDDAGHAFTRAPLGLRGAGRLLVRALGDEVPSAARPLVARLTDGERPADAEQLRQWMRDALGAPASREEVTAAFYAAAEELSEAETLLPAPAVAGDGESDDLVPPAELGGAALVGEAAGASMLADAPSADDRDADEDADAHGSSVDADAARSSPVDADAARSSVDAEARSSVDAEARSSVAAEARSSVAADARSSVAAEARSSVAAEARSSVDADALGSSVVADAQDSPVDADAQRSPVDADAQDVAPEALAAELEPIEDDDEILAPPEPVDDDDDQETLPPEPSLELSVPPLASEEEEPRAIAGEASLPPERPFDTQIDAHPPEVTGSPAATADDAPLEVPEAVDEVVDGADAVDAHSRMGPSVPNPIPKGRIAEAGSDGRKVVRHEYSPPTVSVQTAPAARRSARAAAMGPDSILVPNDRKSGAAWLVVLGAIAALVYFLFFA